MKKIYKSKILLIFLLAIIGGVFVANYWLLDEIMAYAIFLASLFLVILLMRYQALFLGFLIIAGFFLGMWRFALSSQEFTARDLAYFNEKNLEVISWISNEPDIRLDHQRLTTESVELKDEGIKYNVSGKLMTKTNLYPEYEYGDELKIVGKVQTPPEIDGFDYRRYLARYNIYSVIYSPRIYKNETGRGNWLMTHIFRFKNKLARVINYGLPEPQASILSAMILGNRRGIPSDLLEKFSQTGTSHMIAISGMHIGIISAILLSLLMGIGLRRQIVFVVATIFLFLFILMVGAPASAVRAGMMGFLALLAMNLGRLNKSINALLLVATIMLLINPLILLADIGFQLSFSAVLGLIYVLPFFQKWLENIPQFLGIKSAIEMTLSAQVTTLPLIIYYFGKLSLIAPIANVVVVPILPFILISGIITAFLGYFFYFLTRFIFLPVWLLITYVIKIVEFLAGLPGASFEIMSFPVMFLGVSYGVIVYFIIYLNYIKKKYEID